MKKKITGIIMVTVIAVAAGWNMSQIENDLTLSDLILENIEGLANAQESGTEYRNDYKYDPVLQKNICNGPGGKC